MANMILYPPYGTKKEANSLKFEVKGLEANDFEINIEDVTHSRVIHIENFNKNTDGSYSGVMNLDIPEHSSHSSISIFAHIDQKQEDGISKTVQILPAIFSVKEEGEIKKGDFVLSHSFAGPRDLVSIRTKGSPNSKNIFSINDKIFKILINEEGEGSFHFKGKDVIGSNDLETISKFPVYSYEEESNFTKKIFTGSYLNILPTKISLHADIDPRCDVLDPNYLTPGSWVRDPACDDESCDPRQEVCCDPQTGDCECNPILEDCSGSEVIEPCSEIISIAMSPKAGSIGINTEKYCRIHNHSITMLSNGMALHAYTTPDKTLHDGDDGFNVNRIFLSAQATAADIQFIANQDVSVESKLSSEDFRIHVEEDIFNYIVSVADLETSDIYVAIYSSVIGYSKIKITGAEIDDYTGTNILIGSALSISVDITDWVFCTNAVFFHDKVSPNTYIFGQLNQYPLSFVREDMEVGDYSQPVNVSITTNDKYIGIDEEMFVYIVVEAVTENSLSQLYFNSLSLGNSASFSSKQFGWTKLTNENQGNNMNPKAKMDSENNLHVIFESDRGGLKQLYYGVAGLNSTVFEASCFSSSIDKYSEFLSESDRPFDYFRPLLINEEEGNEYVDIPEVITENLVTGTNSFESNGGDVSGTSSLNYLNNITIEANPVYQEALSLAHLSASLEEVNPSEPYLYKQFNYQISFNMNSEVTQTSGLATENVVNDIEIDNLFRRWRDRYTVSIEKTVENLPIYLDEDGNKFLLGRSDNVYDRIVPMVGAYNYSNPSVDGTQIKILKNDSNLKDFTFGLMFEKTYFKATNIHTQGEYSFYGTGTYVQESIETIYTGNAKLVAFIKTEEKSSERADYIIVREFPEKLDVNEKKRYDIIVNYTQMSSNEVQNTLNTYNTDYSDKFLGSLTLLIGGIPRFSQSFISTLESNLELDVGFGVPDGGYYIADKMSPSKLGIFDNISALINFSDITISSPTYSYNPEVVSLSPRVRDITKLTVLSGETEVIPPSNTEAYVSSLSENSLLNLNFLEKEEIKYYVTHSETGSNNYSEAFSVSQIQKITIEFVTYNKADRITVTKEDGTIIHDTGLILSTLDDPFIFSVDVPYINKVYINVIMGTDAGNTSYDFTAYFKKVKNDNTFSQIPITFEGINQSADLALGKCDDIHIAWQSNRDNQWDIYYMNSVDELSMFRHETQITDTESNSLRPSLSVGRNNSRMIVWNDNRDGEFNIYAARSLEDFGCSQKTCETFMAEAFSSEITQCTISKDFTATDDGFYNFVLYFYSDGGLTTLYKVIGIEGKETRWFVDGTSIEDDLLYDGETLLGVELSADQTVTVSYTPDKNDKIFDIILYYKLVGILSEAEE